MRAEKPRVEPFLVLCVREVPTRLVRLLGARVDPLPVHEVRLVLAAALLAGDAEDRARAVRAVPSLVGRIRLGNGISEVHDVRVLRGVVVARRKAEALVPHPVLLRIRARPAGLALEGAGQLGEKKLG